MTSVTLNSDLMPPVYTPTASPRDAQGRLIVYDQPDDQVQLGPAALREASMTGRIAENVAGGNLTSSQPEPYSQVSSTDVVF